MALDPAEQAIAVMHAHITALNAHDADAVAGTLHFPHYRLAGDTVKIWETPDQYFADFQARAGDTWGHSEWGRMDILKATDTKVHLDVEVLRFDRDGQPMVAFDSLWVVTCIGGVWAAQMRSSFAPEGRAAQ